MVGKRQHVVAKSYLQFFATREDPGVVWVLDKHKGVTFKASIGNVCVETRFYEDNLSEDDTEAWLCNMEGKHKSTIERLTRLHPGQPIEGPMQAEIAEFVAVQHVRSKEAREVVAEIGLGMLEVEARSAGVWEPHAARKVIDENVREIHVGGMKESFKEIMAAVEKLRPTVVRRAVEPTFHTSDCPVAAYNNLPEGEMGLEAPGARGVQLYVPLGPDTCLVAYDQSVVRTRPAVVTCNRPGFIEFCNALQTARATRQTFSRDPDFSETEKFLCTIGDWADKDRTRTKTETVDANGCRYLAVGRARRLQLGGDLVPFDRAVFRE